MFMLRWQCKTRCNLIMCAWCYLLGLDTASNLARECASLGNAQAGLRRAHGIDRRRFGNSAPGFFLRHRHPAAIPCRLPASPVVLDHGHGFLLTLPTGTIGRFVDFAHLIVVQRPGQQSAMDKELESFQQQFHADSLGTSRAGHRIALYSHARYFGYAGALPCSIGWQRQGFGCRWCVDIY